MFSHDFSKNRRPLPEPRTISEPEFPLRFAGAEGGPTNQNAFNRHPRGKALSSHSILPKVSSNA